MVAGYTRDEPGRRWPRWVPGSRPRSNLAEFGALPTARRAPNPFVELRQTYVSVSARSTAGATRCPQSVGSVLPSLRVIRLFVGFDGRADTSPHLQVRPCRHGAWLDSGTLQLGAVAVRRVVVRLRYCAPGISELDLSRRAVPGGHRDLRLAVRPAAPWQFQLGRPVLCTSCASSR